MRSPLEGDYPRNPHRAKNFYRLKGNAYSTAVALEVFLHGPRRTKKTRKRNPDDLRRNSNPIYKKLGSPHELPLWAQGFVMRQRRKS